MSLSFNLLLTVCLAYAALLFLVAFVAEKRAAAGRAGWLRSPLVYTLSLSIYCTAWTFYGAVGYAARSGLEFVTIYLGPTLVMVGWWAVLRKMVRIGRTQRITSIADLISSRYGKSAFLGGLVTLLAVLGTTPYIALQLQSVTLSFAVFAAQGDQAFASGLPAALPADNLDATALWVAAGLALFAGIFGTRNLDVNERHHGVVTAIALEAVVKLVALLAVGIFVVWGIAGGPGAIFAQIEASDIAGWQLVPGRWIGLTFLSAAAFLTLPRMFQVLVVENSDERHLATASWAFPLYLFAMSLFVVPIAVVGLGMLPAGANSDLFVLTVPLAADQDMLALLSFLGGFSSATSMVIVAAIALSTMVSNHVVMPIWLRMVRGGATFSGDVRHVVLVSRRLSIAGVLALGYLYFRLSGGGEALAAIGLISFVGVAQVLPALLGGIFWRGATRGGAAGGLLAGFIIWCWTLFLPSFGPGAAISASAIAQGPFGIGWLRPGALFGIEGMDPLIHALLWSMLLNTAGLLIGSLVSFPSPVERLQGAEFVNIFRYPAGARGWTPGTVQSEDLLVMAQRILGATEAQALFQNAAAVQGKSGYLPEPSPDFLERLERELAGSVGAATAHAMLGQLAGGTAVSVEELMRVADETAQIMEYSAQLEAKSSELERTALQLREANEKLTALSIQKDAFLSQISHELRTPMTSIRAFSEILREPNVQGDERMRFSGVIHDEAQRLTRLLDDLLDLSVLENGQVTLNRQRVMLDDVLDAALAATRPRGDGITVIRQGAAGRRFVTTDPDRLAQVFINLIANAGKYCKAERPELRIQTGTETDGAGGAMLCVDFIDNGSGIPPGSQSMIFEKFTRLGDTHAAGSAGLGLAICREIMERLGGTIAYLPGQGGGAFRVRLPAG
ncbi:ATP-binding protein [Profundibacterium mesophilum]|uniref:histidine kinase n=1 Tax=Profundibacterium mesophilum KAUST100406-0324 TaxID=1037889 RepID=A0A921NTQ4_9RHOB|nr:ATP-binding protein [Profundibacterium mesophilum]KAF0675011.1 two-component system OmpR family sensor histidine kinase KdpD [Profundibacterium mesophilum KAUST100406-0324]